MLLVSEQRATLRESERETETETDRQRERNRETERETSISPEQKLCMHGTRVIHLYSIS